MSESFSSSAQKYLQELQLLASALALVAIFCGVILFFLWRKTGIPRQLVGREQAINVPWDWLEVFLAILLLIFVYELIVKTVPWAKHQLTEEAYAGFQVSAAASVLNISVDGGLSGGLTTLVGALYSRPKEIVRQSVEARSYLLNLVLFFPLVLLLFFNVLPKLCGARLFQLGLHLNRWKENITLGTIVWVIITPLCNILLMVVLLSFWETLWGRKSEHPLSLILQNDTQWSTWILVGIVTCIIAPLREEIMFRGIIQPYLVRNPMTSDIIVVLSIIWAFTILMTPGTGPDRGMGMGPLFFIATIAPGYYLFEKWTEPWIKVPGAARGIFATSLIFAGIHFGAWPQPIPLFFLSLALGLLAYRTRSLLGPITVHALFNLTTMVSSLLQMYPRFQ